MPNITIPGYTQVVVVAADITSLHFDRLNDLGTSLNLTVTFQVKDSLGAVRGVKTIQQQVGAYPVALAAILAACNTANGTA